MNIMPISPGHAFRWAPAEHAYRMWRITKMWTFSEIRVRFRFATGWGVGKYEYWLDWKQKSKKIRRKPKAPD